MEPQSPPKRITRSRAAKTGESSTTTRATKIVTAAAKAKSTATAPTRSTSAKRKTRSDDHEDEEHNEQTQESEPALPESPQHQVRRPAEPPVREPLHARALPPAPKEEAPKPTRGRPRKVVQPAEQAPEKEAEPVKKTTRTRAAPVTAAKPAVKKTVTFQEPEKENIAPDASKKTADKSTTATGLRARPVRKPPVPKAPTRATRNAAAATTKTEKTPLSPKKVTQIPMSQDYSEDELAGENTPPRPMMKSPTKPPASVLGSSKKLNLKPVEKSADSKEDQDGEGADSETQEDEVTNVLASPAKRLPPSPFRDTLKSPAKRVEGVSLKPASMSTAEGVAPTPLKASLLHSPAKRPQSAIKPFALPTTGHEEKNLSNLKASLLQSPAKRPLSPIKGLAKPQETIEEMQSPTTKPLLLSTPTALPPAKRSSEKLMEEENGHSDDEEEQLDDVAEAMLNESIHLEEPMQFPGRLSAVLPRHADPVFKKDMPALEEPEEDLAHAEEVDVVQSEDAPEEGDDFATEDMPEFDGEPMMLDEDYFQPQAQSSLAPQPAFNVPTGIFGLRQKDMDPYHSMDSDSDDELANSPRVSAVEKFVPLTPTPKAARRSNVMPRVSNVGFTPLAQKLNAWSAGSPTKGSKTPVAKTPQASADSASVSGTPRAYDSPLRSTYFEDEMTVRADMEAQNEIEAAIEAEISAASEEIEFDDLMVTDEDMALAAEANEMSLMEPGQLDDIVNTSNSFDDTLSEASQEYGDENEMPVDPAMLNGASIPPTTPNRMINREFHTVSKVPLKAADESTPRPKKKRAASISRLPASRPTQNLNRSATVISYSPGKNKSEPQETAEPESAPVTPAKSDIWSSLGTPARTPHRNLSPGLLRGAVVFVDVHTTEGADASSIFVELLTQMGARCVKTWAWNPNAADNSDMSKVGITHVVFKDGGKRTMEKIRETNGIVHCVGVSWVLDCERKNEWLPEDEYSIDTSLVPRGGARRRKSMEPTALANQNGMLVPSPVKGGRDNKTAPNTPMNRRDSTVWMHTPSDEADDEEVDWEGLMSPVPVTPAPDALARYAANVTPETPGATDYDSSPTKLLMQTCPPKNNAFAEMGDSILKREKDETVMQRLMAARRKSLQFAPKIGSPLAKAWR
uniref:BRCT domain-containing protein n=1 Tax=Colletotrichum fructicola (strain Nara gc5) TaxID=1213859 RepID=L2G5A8_COLFN